MRMISPCQAITSLSREVRIVEVGGDCGERSIAKAVSPICGRHVCRAAMTEAQKCGGSLSSSSRESQARAYSASCCPCQRGRHPYGPCAWACEVAAAHAESSVVLPLPAEAESKVSR